MGKIIVIGCSNIDMLAKSNTKLVEKDSNIGTISISDGGVGRNITENLARLGEDVTFITAIGNDTLGKALKKRLTDLKVTLVCPETEKSSAMYLAIHDEKGDMKLAVNDTSIVDCIDIDFIDKNDKIINEAEYLVLGTNLNKEIIDYIINKYKEKKIVVDAISTVKVIKLVDSLKYIYLLKVNMMEYETIRMELAISKPKNLIITNGSQNIIYETGSSAQVVNIIPKENIVNTTGAGDALLSGIVASLNNNYSMIEAINVGVKMANLTLESESSVSNKVTKELMYE